MQTRKATPKYSPEVRERAVRIVQEQRKEYPSLWAAVESIAPKIGCLAHTLLEWVRKYEVDHGLRDGVTSDERERIKVLERLMKHLGLTKPPPRNTGRFTDNSFHGTSTRWIYRRSLRTV